VDPAAQRIEEAILVVRGHRVLLDADLASLYGVPPKRLNEQVRRNHERFPADFMFQLTGEEVEILRSQFATSSAWGGRRYLPYVFTEQGVAMLSSVLRSYAALCCSTRCRPGATARSSSSSFSTVGTDTPCS